MGRFVAGNGQYVIYAKNSQEASQILLQELDRFDDIKAKMASLLSKDGTALQNFLTNTSEENLHIEFDDETSLIFNDPDNATTKGEVKTRSNKDGKFTYDLAYRYPEIQGHNADFRLAHEMGHLMLNPSNASRQTYDKETDTRQVSGLMRVPRGQENDSRAIYGTRMQENAINLLAELAVRGEHSADDIITGKVDVSEFNSYKKVDDLVKLLAVSMRNDFDTEMSFEELVNNKIDSFIEHADGTKEPANTFFYGILNDSSMIENEFNKYIGKGAWRDLNSAFEQLHQPNISQERFNNIFQTAQALINEFANVRMQEKHKEVVARNGQDVIRPARDEVQQPNQVQAQTQDKLSLKQRVAQFLQRNNLFMNLSFVDKFVHQQLDVLPPETQTRTQTINNSRESFVNWLSNNGEYRNLPPIRRLSDPERMAQMQRKMQQNTKSNDGNERG